MIKRCRFCGQKVQSDTVQCPHCNKELIKRAEPESETVGLNNIENWKTKSVPAWVMYAVIVLALLYLALVISKGCDGPSEGDGDGDTEEVPVTQLMTIAPQCVIT
jgi:uncharacterized membrane protein YvbJ